MDALTLPICARGMAVCTADGVRVRLLKPGTGEVVGSLARGQAVTVYAVDNGWAIVDTGLRRTPSEWLAGWVSMQFLKVGTLVP